jgi:hypothetical protein
MIRFDVEYRLQNRRPWSEDSQFAGSNLPADIADIVTVTVKTILAIYDSCRFLLAKYVSSRLHALTHCIIHTGDMHVPSYRSFYWGFPRFPVVGKANSGMDIKAVVLYDSKSKESRIWNNVTHTYVTGVELIILLMSSDWLYHMLRITN